MSNFQNIQMVHNRLYVLASVVVLSFILIHAYLYFSSNQPQYACVNDDYKIFFTEVVIGNSYAPLHYRDSNGNKHYNYGADVILVEGEFTDELCEKYWK